MGVLGTLRQAAPWWVRVAAKMAVGGLPIPYAAWRRLSLFQHGSMERPQYVFDVVRQHLERSGFLGQTGFVALELGPGDSLGSMIVARAFGAAGCYLVDVGSFARRDLAPYLELCRFLRERGMPLDDLESARSIEELSHRCRARYLTGGIESLREIRDEAIDVVWSQAALEHVPRGDLPALLAELRRVLRRGGVASHTIDLSDHLGGGLNHLRFSERFWEGGVPAHCGFYTNRLRFSEMLALFERARFGTEVTKVARWQSLPTPRTALHAPYDSLPVEELCVSGFDVRLRPAAPGAGV